MNWRKFLQKIGAIPSRFDVNEALRWVYYTSATLNQDQEITGAFTYLDTNEDGSPVFYKSKEEALSRAIEILQNMRELLNMEIIIFKETREIV